MDGAAGRVGGSGVAVEAPEVGGLQTGVAAALSSVYFPGRKTI